MTLYTVGGVKEVKGYKNYVSVDGGMTDNPRYALYGSQYTIYNATNADKEPDYVATIAGRCCESGDLIQEDVKIAKPERNDIIAVATTGAYNYSMASNYNRVARPPVVMLSENGDYLAVKRETLDDLIKLDI
jgi:diaminopimelate decarboxylase